MFPGYKNDRIEVTQTPEGRLLLSIQNVQRIDAGKIIVCSAVNSVGSTSTRVVVTINTQEERPPPIIVQGPANQTLPIKSVARLGNVLFFNEFVHFGIMATNVETKHKFDNILC